MMLEALGSHLSHPIYYLGDFFSWMTEINVKVEAQVDTGTQHIDCA